jgi:regulatory protein
VEERRDFKEAYSYALRLLSKRDYSEKALKQKLSQKFPVEIVDELLRELKSQGFINEFEAVKNYFLSKVKKGWGRRKIAFHLRALGFKEEVIGEVELTIPFDYSYIASEVEKKFDLRKDLDREKAKQFHLRRGFTFLEVEKILRFTN